MRSIGIVYLPKATNDVGLPPEKNHQAPLSTEQLVTSLAHVAHASRRVPPVYT